MSEKMLPGGSMNIAVQMLGIAIFIPGYRVDIITQSTTNKFHPKFANFVNQLPPHIKAWDIKANGHISIKTRYVVNENMVMREDDDQISFVNWEDDNLEFISAGRTCDVQPSIKNIRNTNYDVVLVKDYGKGLVNSTLEHFLLTLKYKLLIYEPHITSYKRGFIKNADVVKMNTDEYESILRAIWRNSKDENELASIGKYLGINKFLIVTNPTGMNCMQFGNDNIFRICKNIYTRMAPNVVGAGDIVTALLTMLISSEGLDLEDDYGEFICDIAALKCQHEDLGYMRELIVEYYREYVEKAPIILSYRDLKKLAHYINMERDLLCSNVVLANGVFDGLHLGHLKLFDIHKEVVADNAGKFVPFVIAMNSDRWCRLIKGCPPKFNNQERAQALAKFANYVVIFDTEKQLENICKICQPIMIKGIEYRGKNITGEQYCKNVLFNDNPEIAKIHNRRNKRGT
jgi:bifunctional ADP-heptose synthase (sugar kinase/adenylyltransferase)